MKKLLIFLLATVTVIAFALPPFRIYNPTIMQRAGLDSLSITINDSDSVNITTSKEFISYNKPLKVNGDSLPTITRVKELIKDSMQTITGFVDLTSEQTITGIKTFNDIYASSVDATMLISNNIYNSDGNAAIISSNYSNNEKLITYNSAIDNIIYSKINDSTLENDFRLFDGVGNALIISLPYQTSYFGYGATELIHTDENETTYYGLNTNLITTNQYGVIYYGYDGIDFLTYSPTTTTINRGDTAFITMADTTIRAQKNLVAPKFYVSALNEAPASATAEGTTGEIRITTNYIYVCVSDDVWVRTELTTWP